MAVEFDTPGYLRTPMSSIWSNDVRDVNGENKISAFSNPSSGVFRAASTAPTFSDLFRDSANLVSADAKTAVGAKPQSAAPGKDANYSSSNLFSSCWSPVPDEKLNAVSSWPWIDTDQNRQTDERSDSVNSGSDSLTSPVQLSPIGHNPWTDAAEPATKTFRLFENLPAASRAQAEKAYRRHEMAKSAWNAPTACAGNGPQKVDLADTMRQFDQLYVSPANVTGSPNGIGRSMSYANGDNGPVHQRMPHSPNSVPVLQQYASNAWPSTASRADPHIVKGRKQSANAWVYANYNNSFDNEPNRLNCFRPIVGQASDSLSSPGSSNSSLSCEASPINGPIAYPNAEHACGAMSNASRQQQRPVATCDEAELNWYHQQLELQQSIYEHFYNLLLCGQLPMPSGMNRSFGGTRTAAMPTTAQLSRGSTAAQDLHQRLEQVTESYKQMEKERKKTEAELARHNLGKRISSANNLPIPRLPPAPSRVDRLVVDFFREHARMVTLLGKMEQLRGEPFDDKVHAVMRELLDAVRVLQQRRLNERTAILQQLRGEIGRYNEEKEAAQLTLSLIEVNKCVIRARSANWCALMWTIGSVTDEQRAQIETIVRSNFNESPPEIKLCAVPV